MNTVSVYDAQGTSYSVEVPHGAPLYAVSDTLARILLLPAEHMIYYSDTEERLSRYEPVLRDCSVYLRVRKNYPNFLVFRRVQDLLYTDLDAYESSPVQLRFIKDVKEWDPLAVELEDAIVHVDTASVVCSESTLEALGIDFDPSYTIRMFHMF